MMYCHQLKYAPATEDQLRKQKLLKDLFMWQRPFCRCCGVKLTTQVPAKGKKEPDNLATIEHIYPSTSLRRYTANGERFMTLFCKKCNCNKGYADSPHSIQAQYDNLFPAFDIRTLLPIHKTRTRWLYLLNKRKAALNKGKTFNIQQYR